MKIRSGFVSNSSSSSFVVINAKKGYLKPDFNNPLVVDYTFGTTEFGWGPDIIYDLEGRIIFAYLQYLYTKKEEWLEMLERVIKNNTLVKNIEWIIEIDNYKLNVYAYIDHQSSSAEGMNTEIFDSEQTLKDFIFGNGSYIQLENDND